jgi:hypothetical protein
MPPLMIATQGEVAALRSEDLGELADAKLAGVGAAAGGRRPARRCRGGQCSAGKPGAGLAEALGSRRQAAGSGSPTGKSLLLRSNDRLAFDGSEREHCPAVLAQHGQQLPVAAGQFCRAG